MFPGPVGATHSQLAAQEALSRRDYVELFSKLGRTATPDHVVTLLGMLWHGVLRQLSSFPVDLRVERELVTAAPEHALLQREYLEQQLADFSPTFDEGMLSLVPSRLYMMSTAMNVAFTKEAALIASLNVPIYVQNHRSRPQGDALLDALHSAATESGHRGDRMVTDAWARLLELEGTYCWMPWESV
jgi:hypothetical protein